MKLVLKDLYIGDNPHWNYFHIRSLDDNFNNFKTEVLKRDNGTCQYCGFKVGNFGEVVNSNQDYTVNKLANMVTACVFCMQCQFLSKLSFMDKGSGKLILLPELSQAKINNLFNNIGKSIVYDQNNANLLKATLKGFASSIKSLESVFGDNSSNPQIFFDIMKEINYDFIKDEQKLKDKIKFLPNIINYIDWYKPWKVVDIS
jgi:intracellular multiplication protein IcmJ